jgi:SAM-dependent methyltransferase
LSFTLPSLSNAEGIPDWTGHGFRVGNQLLPVLEYSENFDGWSDDLTLMHEETVGKSHPIDRASRGDALAQLKAQLREPCPSILEIGCSSGFLLKEMRQAFPAAVIIGADVVREPLYKLAKESPSIPLLRFDLLKCPLPSDAFDAVVALNVLEHIEDDAAALAQVHRILKPGGVIVIEVPAGPHLYDAYDNCLMHFRRYRSAELADKLRHGGFDVVRRSHLGFFLVHPGEARAGVEKSGHADSTWSCVELLQTRRSACPPVCCTMPSASAGTSTRAPSTIMAK